MAKKKGFTLVELIVVIAIIAILGAVLVPSFARFIDDSRFSNDTQRAASMTRILESHMITDAEDSYDAHDIQTIIDQYNDGAYDMTPESSNTGFFYLSSSNRIIAEKYDRIEDYVDVEELDQQVRLLSYELDISSVERPEAVFGDDRLLLTTEGSPVAKTVHFINHMASYGSAIDEAYDEAYNTLNSGNLNLIARFFGFGMSAEMTNKMIELMERFDPAKTLYVNNTSWVASKDVENLDSIERVVFRPGMSNVPTFNIDKSGTIGLDTLTLPRSVKTIRSEAFPDTSFSVDEIEIRSQQVVAYDNAFTGVTAIPASKVVAGDAATLRDFSDYITVSEVGGKKVYDLSLLREELGIDIAGYNIYTFGDYYEIMIYTNEGLLGFAKNIFTVTFYYNHPGLDTDNVYDVYRSMENSFVASPLDPEIPGYTFLGWYDNPEGTGDALTGAEELQNYNTNVYAFWQEA